jgi:hypothetical protein
METTMTDEAQTPPTTQPAALAPHIENSTDATRGEPLATRAHKRKLELQAAADKLGPEVPSRKDIELAIASIDALLLGDAAHLSHATSAELSRLLESSKHLGENALTSTPAPTTTEPATTIDAGTNPVIANGEA